MALIFAFSWCYLMTFALRIDTVIYVDLDYDMCKRYKKVKFTHKLRTNDVLSVIHQDDRTMHTVI